MFVRLPPGLCTINLPYYQTLRVFVFVPSQSVFGKGLTTILNEYVATKAKGEVFRWCSSGDVCVGSPPVTFSVHRVPSRGAGCHDFIVEEARFHSQPAQVSKRQRPLKSLQVEANEASECLCVSPQVLAELSGYVLVSEKQVCFSVNVLLQTLCTPC